MRWAHGQVRHCRHSIKPVLICAAFTIAPDDGSYDSVYQEIDQTYVQSIKDSDEVKRSLSHYALRESGLSAGM